MGSPTEEGESPVHEKPEQPSVSRVPPDTWNPVGNRGDHPPSLNTTWWPIEEQYREGKVKRTPGGEWKRTWNLVLTSTQSPLKGDEVLFVERSGELLYVASLRYSVPEAKRERVWTGRKEVACNRPETRWPIHEQVEVEVKLHGGPNRPPLQWWRMTCG